MKIPEVASKPPSKGLFIQEPPSELVILTERGPPVATMDGRLHICWQMTSHLAISSVEFPQQNVRLDHCKTQLLQKTEERNTIIAIQQKHLSISE